MNLVDLVIRVSAPEPRSHRPRQALSEAPWGLEAPQATGTGKPITSFLLKVASRCNLDCDYCYVYRGPDQSWRRKPKLMDPAVVEQTIFRIAQHVEAHRPPQVSVVLHGG